MTSLLDHPVTGFDGINDEGFKEFFTSRPMTITAQEAQHVLENENYDPQRPIIKKDVTRYRSDMRRGEWRDGSEIKFGQLPDGRRFLFSGHHRFKAQIAEGATIRYTVTTHYVENMEDLDKYYLTTNTGRKMSFCDADQIFGVSERIGINGRNLNRALAAAKLIRAAFDRVTKASNLSLHAQRDMVLFWEEELRTYFQIIESSRPQVKNTFTDMLASRLTSSAVMSVALVTLRFQPEKAAQFWREVATDLHTSHTYPPKILCDYLRNLPAAEGYLVEGIVKNTANLWTAWCEGKEVKHLKKHTNGGNVNIWGTPFTYRKNERGLGAQVGIEES
jgi:hypothetical protein